MYGGFPIASAEYGSIGGRASGGRIVAGIRSVILGTAAAIAALSTKIAPVTLTTKKRNVSL